jgi:hypothetical protein
MQQSSTSPLAIAPPIAAPGDAAIRISRLDSWTTPGSAAAMEFCFFCLAVPADDAIREA